MFAQFWYCWTGQDDTSDLQNVIYQLSGIDRSVLRVSNEACDAGAPVHTSSSHCTPADCFFALCALAAVDYHLNRACQSSYEIIQWSVNDVIQVCQLLLRDSCVQHHSASSDQIHSDSVASEKRLDAGNATDDLRNINGLTAECDNPPTTSLETLQCSECHLMVNKTLWPMLLVGMRRIPTLAEIRSFFPAAKSGSKLLNVHKPRKSLIVCVSCLDLKSACINLFIV